MAKFALKLAALAGSACALVAAAPGHAQQTPDIDAAKDATGEILVTARRQSERLQNVPLSVQAFSGDELDRAGVGNLTELANRVPGAKFNTANATDPEVFIRGIGSDIQGAGADGSIGFFLDGVYLSRATGTLIDLFDLERVEVLKGPQSLRFGKNVVGGLIHYITRKPGQETEGRIEGTYGSYNQIDVAASARMPLSDTVAVGLTLSSRNRDGFGKNTLGGDEEDISVQSARLALRFTPSETVDLVIAGDYTRRRDGARWVDVLVPGTSNAVTYNRFFAPPIPGLPANFSLPARNLPFKNEDPRKGPRNFSGYQNADLYGLSANLDVEASDSVSINSITAYRTTKLDVREDGCGMFWNFPRDAETGIPIITRALEAVENQQDVFAYLNDVPDCWFDNGKKDDTKAFSQEVRLSFDNGGPFKWSAGIYFLEEDIDRLERVAFLFPDFDTITNIAFALAFGGPVDPPVGGISNARTRSKARNLGLFAEGTYKFSDTLSLNGGLRYAHDRKRVTVQRFGDSFDRPLPPGGFITSGSNSWDAWLPSVTLAYQPDSNTNIFARIERGYKAGGYTGENAGNPEDALISFAPEYALSYEVGGKFLLLERTLRVNVTGFYTKYDDLQTQQFLQLDPTRPPDNFVVNAENGARAYGLELDLFARPVEGLSVYGNYAYTRCNFTGELIIAQGVDIDGNVCRRTPEHAIAVGLDFSTPVSDRMSAGFGADLQHTASYFFNNNNEALTRNPAETTLNARVTLESVDGWRLTGWVKNLTDQRNFASKFELFDTVYANYQPPRTFGVTLGYQFGK